MARSISLVLPVVLLIAGALFARAATFTVETGNFFFRPTNVTISVGDTVTWVNVSFATHDATPGRHATYNGEEPWVVVASQESGSYTFTQAGVFPYLCLNHFNRLQQTGTVTVVAANLPPAVQLTNPANNATFIAPASFTLSADASDVDGNVTSVEFFVNGVAVGNSQGPAFSVPLSELGPGSYTLTARATDNSGAQTTSAPVNITVVAPPNTYALSISTNPPDSGSVQVSPPPNAAGGKYLEGTAVTLTAVAATERAFTNWSGAVANAENPLTIAINSNTTVTANFITTTVPSFALILVTNPPAAGAIEVAPAPNGPNGTYLRGSIVTLTATANFGNRFDGWSGAVLSAAAEVMLTMDADKSVTATFAEVPIVAYTLALLTNPSGAGTITVSPAPNAPNGKYIEGTVVTLVAAAVGTNAFESWSGSITSASNQLSLVMDADKNATANFVPIIPPRFTLSVTVTPSNAGAILITPDADTNGTYAEGTAVALAAQPNAGFRFDRWTGGVVSSNNPLLVLMIADRTLVANFTPIPSLDFGEVGGTYAGLLLDESEIDFATSGFLSLRVARTGAYRGTAMIGGIRQFVAGQFDRFGYAPLVLRRGTLSGSLQIDIENQRITGTLTDGRKSPGLLLYRAMPSTNAAALSGAFNLLLEANQPVAVEGSAAATIAPNGIVRIRGALGDGTRFTERTFLTPDLRAPVFVPLYQNRGGLIGWLDFKDAETPRGQLRWTRPGDSRHPHFPDGFAVGTLVNGARAE